MIGCSAVGKAIAPSSVSHVATMSRCAPEWSFTAAWSGFRAASIMAAKAREHSHGVAAFSYCVKATAGSTGGVGGFDVPGAGAEAAPQPATPIATAMAMASKKVRMLQ